MLRFCQFVHYEEGISKFPVLMLAFQLLQLSLSLLYDTHYQNFHFRNRARSL